MQMWEYAIQTYNMWDEATAGLINSLGAEGWELVGVATHTLNNSNLTCVFKRPRA